MTVRATIDITPESLKSQAGIARVNAAQERLENAIREVANTTSDYVDDLDAAQFAHLEHSATAQQNAREAGTEAVAQIRRALNAWKKAGSDFAFILGNIDPETRQRYVD